VIETVWLDNPPVNAVNSGIIETLWNAFENVSPDVNVVVLRGKGERAFSAGADITGFVGGAAEGDRPAGIQPVADLIEAAPVPVVAAIHGYCLGGGLELALATDFRVADETAVFGFPEVSLGIIPSSGGTYRLVRLVGPGRAKELFLLGGRFDAATGLAAGLVTEVVGSGAALDRSLELARQLVELSPLAVSLTKQAIDVMPGASREAGILIERLAYAMLAQSEDAKARADDWSKS